ncbi:hypothetical protein AWN68_03955 [Roseivirga echinicomitans]|uniref:Uncharacterized protein n=2 Tax=Roseivirga echinicomitans TaxID=296218 RepID=A0A150XJE9_9BACT|nr:hypothetical protein AWN68_03955 [Roseivirga echinicomitans]
MLAVFACAPDQFQSSQEYDDVYFTSADRTSKPTIIESTQEIESSNEKAFSLGDYSSESVDPTLVSKYNNSQDGEVVYFEEGPIVKQARDLNYDDFIYDYENENLAYYELPLDWNTDWDKWSFNKIMVNDFQFQLAWYEQYYLNRDSRMNTYLSGGYGKRRNGLTVPRVGLDIFGSSVFYPGFYVSMSYVTLNNFYGPSNFFIRSPYYGSPWSYRDFYSPYYVNYYGWWDINNRNPGRYYTGNYYHNYYYNKEGSRDDRDITRGGRISSTSVSSVRTDAINGSTPNTRSSRYASNLGAQGSRAGGADGFQVVGGRNSSTATSSGNARSSRVNTNAYQFSNDSRLTRSNVVRSSNARSSRSQTYADSRSASSSSVVSGRSSSSSSNLFSRSSSTRSATPSYSRSSSSSSRNSGVSSSRSSSSSSSRSSGVSSNRSSSNNSSSSRSSGTVSSSSSRSGNSSSSSSSRSGNSSSSSSSSTKSSSSRSGRGN